MNITLLRQLREAQGEFVPLDGLSGADLDELEAFGFAFERHPYRGVAYRGPAARLCPDQIEDGLGTRRVGRRVAIWNRVGSTNDVAARASASSANEGLVVLAEEQSAGRGSRGRVWTAPKGSSLLMSILLFPPASLAETGWLTALGAVAVAEVVADWTGLETKIKWPNDVRVHGRKIAGILVERGAGAVIGIGLNVNLERHDFPELLRETATSLRILKGEPIDRSELARELIRRVDDWYEAGLQRGPESLNFPWRNRSEHLGGLVLVDTPSGRVEGRVEDLDLLRGLTLAPSDGAPSRRIAAHNILALSPSLAESGELSA